jgi:hypothetical protein
MLYKYEPTYLIKKLSYLNFLIYKILSNRKIFFQIINIKQYRFISISTESFEDL